jgi:hypothetical protein
VLKAGDVQFGTSEVRLGLRRPAAEQLLVSMTRIERHMANGGEHERLRDLRMHFQCRKVRSFVSGIDTKRDVSAELFYLEPRS